MAKIAAQQKKPVPKFRPNTATVAKVKAKKTPAPNGHTNGNGRVLDTAPARGKSLSSDTVKFKLPEKLLIQIHEEMLAARLLEERLIRMYKKNDGYFWLGGPGEEAFQIPMAHHVKKGQGLDHDFFHFHYRATPTLLTMGMDPMDMMRQMKNTATDPFSGGRNFVAHASVRKWNVAPITSTIETQYLTSIGTGIAHRRHGGEGISIVTGGDAGTAEGDFASCLVWASRPGKELPLFIVVTNNHWGISTPEATQHGDKLISARGKAFGIKSCTINGNDVEESYLQLKEAMEYVRTERKPFLMEAYVSRLYGHSSATGANFISNEEDPLVKFEQRLEKAGVVSRAKMDELREKYTQAFLEMSRKVIEEPMPDPSTIYDHTYQGQKGRYW